jgi:nickel transport protein
MNGTNQMNQAIIRGFAAVICCLFFSNPAFAHRVILFGWVEGDRVMTQSKFSSNRVVKGGDITVFDVEGNPLLKGKTDDTGEFSFQIPGRESLKIVLFGGASHRAEWVISESELASASENHQHMARDSVPDPGVVMVKGHCSEQEIEAAVEKVMDLKLRPVLKYIAESRQHAISLGDVVGGFGYIMGLVGLVTYLRFRPRKRQDA